MAVSIDPKAAAIRSAILPGWGQLSIHKPIKAALFFGAESFLMYQFIHYQQIHSKVEQTRQAVGIVTWENEMSEEERIAAIKEETGYQLEMVTTRPRELRNRNGWRYLAVYLVCLLDVYVDAHLMKFPQEKVELSSTWNRDGIGIRCSIALRR